MAKAKRFTPEAGEDPYMIQFDKGVALLGYGLLIVSPFMAGLPAAASLAIAFAHRGDAHPVMRSHYRFQARIFWITAALMAVAILLLLGGGGVALTTAFGFAQAHVAGLALPAWLTGGYADAGERTAANGALIGGVLAGVAAVFWLFVAAFWGAFKLVLGRPIGLSR
jgi:uncharacterized membrane protein